MFWRDKAKPPPVEERTHHEQNLTIRPDMRSGSQIVVMGTAKRNGGPRSGIIVLRHRTSMPAESLYLDGLDDARQLILALERMTAKQEQFLTGGDDEQA